MTRNSVGRSAARTRLWLAVACPVLLSIAGGCVGSPWKVAQQAVDSTRNTSRSMLSALRLAQPLGPDESEAQAAFDEALDLYRQQKFAEAQRRFHEIAYGRRTPRDIAEEALFYEAEALRMQQYYPAAAETYSKLVSEFPRGRHHYDALERMFEIANYWLDDTRAEMEAHAKSKDGRPWFTRPISFINFSRTKPMLDVEGNAVRLLEKIYLNDIDGPLGEKALFFLGSVNFFRGDYVNADHYFYQVLKFHPNGKFAPKALELSIMCKQRIPGGPDYDDRKIVEARELVHRAVHAYPELARDKEEFIQRQLYTITLQQAAKDFQVAEFYERVGHPGSAYFYYELVRRRYPGTKYAEDAAKRMAVLREQAERQRQNQGGGLLAWLPFLRGGSSPTSPEASQAPLPGAGATPPVGSMPQVTPGGAEIAPPPRPVP